MLACANVLSLPSLAFLLLPAGNQFDLWLRKMIYSSFLQYTTFLPIILYHVGTVPLCPSNTQSGSYASFLTIHHYVGMTPLFVAIRSNFSIALASLSQSVHNRPCNCCYSFRHWTVGHLHVPSRETNLLLGCVKGKYNE